MNQNYEGEFEWSDTLQANVLAGFFYGFIATNSLGGLLADKYGAKRVVGGSILSASILTILHPSLSRISGYLTLVLRILTGMASGSIYPGIHSLYGRIHSLYGRWAPPQEIGSLVGLTFSGLNLGNIVGLSTSGYLCVYGFGNGWGSIFYIFGGISLVFGCVWFYFVYDTPDFHPTISEKERSYLNRSIKSEKVVKKVPWRRLISSPAVWAISVGRFAHSWTSLTFQVLLPLYMKEALNVNATSNGLMSSAPSVAQIIALPLCGNLADFIRSKKYMSTRCVRVLFQTIALIASGCLLIVIGFLRCDQTILITILLFLIGITLSFSSGGVVVNNNDIAPSYAELVAFVTLYSIDNIYPLAYL
uniref:Major facilitator superfamily (MFS) profile domain-containing protein n=1 Tax=Octopus bimaculoides TaxID=37653 RepID=A0A0L8HSX8_OCTBM